MPWAIVSASYKRYAHSSAHTEITEIAGHGHSLTIDSGWHEVADAALAFIDKHPPAQIH